MGTDHTCPLHLAAALGRQGAGQRALPVREGRGPMTLPGFEAIPDPAPTPACRGAK